MDIKEQILKRFENTDSGGMAGGRNGLTQREKILLNIAVDVASKISINPPVISCACPEEDKHGETKIWCCNHCGLSTEDWWGKH